MKKYASYLMFIICLFICISTVSAKEIVRCTYTVPFPMGTNVSFSLTVNDDNSLKYSHPTGDYIDAGSESYFWLYNINGYSKALYNNKKVPSVCPELNVIFDFQAGNFVRVDYGSTKSELETAYPGSNIYAALEGARILLDKDVETETEEEVRYCDRKKTTAAGDTNPFNIRFFKKNGKNYFEIIDAKDNTNKVTKEADGIVSITLGGSIYYISLDPDWNNVKDFFSKDCTSTDPLNPLLWLHAPGGAGDPKTFYITSKQPPDELNPNIIIGNGEDNGGNYVEPDPEGNGTGANSGNWDPESLCGKKNENCNIDITAFCNDSYVSRTLKFLGLLLMIAKILVPALIIVLGFVDLFKIITSGKMDEAKKQAKNIFVRVLIGVAIFLLPTILNTIFNIAQGIAQNGKPGAGTGTLNVPKNFENCVNCILDPGNCKVIER